MEIIFTTFFLISTYFCSFCQQKSFLIKDKETKQPIEYASICFLKQLNWCTISDSAGKFFINKILGDSILITRVGYSDTVISITNILENNDINLTRTMEMLPEVIISNNDFDEEYEIGVNKKKNLSISMVPNLEFGKAFFNEVNFSKIKEITFYTAPINNANHKILIEIYNFDTDKNLPSNKLYSKIVLINPVNKRINKVNVAVNEDIIVKNNFFIAIKYLGSENPENYFILLGTSKEKNFATYNRFRSGGWQNYRPKMADKSSENLYLNLLILATLAK